MLWADLFTHEDFFPYVFTLEKENPRWRPGELLLFNILFPSVAFGKRTTVLGDDPTDHHLAL